MQEEASDAEAMTAQTRRPRSSRCWFRPASAFARLVAATLLWCAALFVAAVGVGVLVRYWSDVVDVALIVLGIGGIVLMTLWSD